MPMSNLAYLRKRHSKRFSLHSLRACNTRRAAVTVEFALTIGLVFFFFFAAFEFTRVAMVRHTIENAIYEGARQGVVPGATSDAVEAKVRSVLGIIGIRSSTIDVQPQRIALATPEISVTVEVPVNGNMYLPPIFFKDRFMKRTIVMQRETPSNAR